MTLVLGVDGCPGGWCVVPVGVNRLTVGEPAFAPSFHLLLDTDAAVIAVDIPIGLPHQPGQRSCDIEARRLLGPRRSCVFSPPSRAALSHLDSYRRACEANLAATSKKLSRQAFGIAPKMREVDETIEPAWQERIREAHPELCFWSLNGGRPLLDKKKSAVGLSVRWGMLRGVFGGLPSEPPPRSSLPARCGIDDYVDALACAWTAVCVIRGSAVRIPDAPATDGRGLRMEMWLPG
jgi:predicted RNase H-like nuclease